MLSSVFYRGGTVQLFNFFMSAEIQQIPCLLQGRAVSSVRFFFENIALRLKVSQLFPYIPLDAMQQQN